MSGVRERLGRDYLDIQIAHEGAHGGDTGFELLV